MREDKELPIYTSPHSCTAYKSEFPLPLRDKNGDLHFFCTQCGEALDKFNPYKEEEKFPWK